jgi:molybdopterin synthase sulfur carrier subunit
MKIEIRLFGCFSEFEPGSLLRIELSAAAAKVADARAAVQAYGLAHWPRFKPDLLRVSAFASEDSLLRDGAEIPADGQLCLLPPVSGG